MKRSSGPFTRDFGSGKGKDVHLEEFVSDILDEQEHIYGIEKMLRRPE